VAEAGAYLGILYFLTLWFPQAYRVRVVGVLTLGSAMGNMSGAVLSGTLLDLPGTWGMAGWQWVFIATGVPAILLTLAVLLFLPNDPGEARFLTADEKAWLGSTISREAQPASPHLKILTVLWDSRVLFFVAVYTLILISLYGVIYWLPTMVHGFGVTGGQNGLLNAIPWAIDVVALLSLPRLPSREEAVVSAMAMLALVGLVSFFVSTMVSANWLQFAAIAIGTPCISLMIPCFWSLPARFFSGARAAAPIGAISSVGNLGGFLAQNLTPWVGHAARSNVAAMLVPAICLRMLGIGAVILRPSSSQVATAA
jgi:MFS family permease